MIDLPLINDDFLAEVGLAELPLSDKPAMLEHIRSTLEFRIGTKLTANLSPELVVEFDAIMQQQQTDVALAWLQQHLPHHPQIVQQELTALKQEITDNAEQIVQTARSKAS